MKIYTRRGDGGETDLFGGQRVSKSDLRVRAYGEIDELNAQVGVACAASVQAEIRDLLEAVQRTLFDLGAYLATPSPDRRDETGIPGAGPEEVAELEAHIDRLERELPALKSFVLPGGTSASAAFHVARTVCRRAERSLVELHGREPLDASALRYVNRLSDLLFVIARVENRRAGAGDVEWVGRRR